MTLVLKIGKPIVAEIPPVNTYELVATGMSGDGDHYEESSHFGGLDEIMPYVQLLHALETMNWNATCEEKHIDRVLKTTAAEVGLDLDHASDWFHDMVGHDITSEDRYAMLNGIEMFWYDVNGQKFEVEIKQAD